MNKGNAVVVVAAVVAVVVVTAYKVSKKSVRANAGKLQVDATTA
jgi:hypothetical protein